MKLWDVNLWVYAFREDSPAHERAHTLVSESLERREQFILCPSAASSFLRLVTNRRISIEPSSPAEAWAFIDYLESHPAAVFAEADAMTFGIFKHLCLVSAATSNVLPDAFLAAIAQRHDATLLSADAGKKRFQGVDMALV